MMNLDEVIHQLFAAVITVKMMEIADKIMQGDNLYPIVRPLIVSSLLCSSYRAIRVEREAVQ